MLAKLQLEKIVSALTCLLYSTNFATFHIDSQEVLYGNITTTANCQMNLIADIMTRMQALTERNQAYGNEVKILKSELAALKNGSYNITSSPMTDLAVIAPEKVYATSCTAQKHGIVRVKVSEYFKPLSVICDQETNGGNWLVIAYRFDGSLDFYRNWTEYRNGFGNLYGEFFIGLDRLHAITKNSQPTALLIIMESVTGHRCYAHYTDFVIASVEDKFKLLQVGDYSGNAGDGLSYHVDKAFSTHDGNHSMFWESCSQFSSGAWWYDSHSDFNLNKPCYKSNLFGLYNSSAEGKRIRWLGSNDSKHILKTVKMSVRY